SAGNPEKNPLIVPLFEGFYDTCNLLTCSAGKCRNDILRRRLEQSDDIPDKLFAALDGYEHVEVLVAYINTFFHIRGLEHRLPLWVLFAELLDNLCRSLVDGREHDRSRAAEHSLELFVRLVRGFERLFEKGVLHDHETYFLHETVTAERRCLCCVEFGDVCYVEVRVFVVLGGQRLFYLSFFFLVYCLRNFYFVSIDFGSISKQQ